MIDIYPTDKTIVIWGFSATGKTTLGEILSKKMNCKLIKTDDYIPYGFKESIYRIFFDLKDISDRVIIEGVQIPRMLRAGLENNFKPDLVIICKANEFIRSSRHKARGNDQDAFDKRVAFDGAQQKVFDEYLTKMRSEPKSIFPRFYEHDTSNL